MNMPDSKRHIVRPFGLIGGQYEVDDAGHRKYWLAVIVAVAGGGLVIFQEPLGISGLVVAAGAVLATAIAFALCADIVRKGRKI